jgi:hypothetical protein
LFLKRDNFERLFSPHKKYFFNAICVCICRYCGYGWGKAAAQSSVVVTRGDVRAMTAGRDQVRDSTRPYTAVGLRRSAIFESHLFGSARSVANVIGFARRSSGLARWVALIVLFCVTSPYERAYAMNDRPGSFQPKTGQTVYPQWWSSTAPDGEEFELPSGTKTCSRLKVRFVEQITWVHARVGSGYPSEANFLVEDNFGDQQYGSGKILKASFYVQYNDIHFGHSEINRKLGASDFWFQDRNDANHVLLVSLGDRPETTVSYHVCAFKEGEQVRLSYFLKRSPPHPWPY